MIFRLTEENIFPDPILSEDDGLLAVGGDLNPDRLILAYANGIFPWYNPDDEILWWASPYRPVYFPGEVKLSKSMKASLRKYDFEIKLDNDFDTLINNCASVYRKDQEATWISDEIKESYKKLFEYGYIHTVEIYINNEMVGGLYGASLGKSFFGESMFHTISDASKIALYALSEMLKDWGFLFIDSQISNPHSFRMGAKELSKDNFMKLLDKSMDNNTIQGPWEYDFSKIIEIAKI